MLSIWTLTQNILTSIGHYIPSCKTRGLSLWVKVLQDEIMGMNLNRGNLRVSGSEGRASAYNAGDWVRSLGKEMATHSSTLAWKIPWTEKPGRLQPMGLQRVRHNWATSLSLYLHHVMKHKKSQSLFRMKEMCWGRQFLEKDVIKKTHFWFR